MYNACSGNKITVCTIIQGLTSQSIHNCSSVVIMFIIIYILHVGMPPKKRKRPANTGTSKPSDHDARKKAKVCCVAIHISVQYLCLFLYLFT